MRKFILLLLACAAFAAPPAHARLQVLACEPEWAALVQELAGDRAKVRSATTARQDPHRVEARPALLAQARRADLLVCTGAELEIGWLPLLQREAGNARIQSGQPGYFEASRHVALRERPAQVDRSMGDVHAAGNPHVHLDPRNLLVIADALTPRLKALDPAGAADYDARHATFTTRMHAAITRWETMAAPLKGVKVIAHHGNWAYLAHWLGIEIVAHLEPKPGIEPSAAQLAQLLQRLQDNPARMVLRTAYQSPRASEWIAERTGMRAVMLPYTVGGTDEASDLYALFDDTLARLLGALQ